MPIATDRKKGIKTKVAALFDWRTTDADEIQRRRDRAQTEPFEIVNIDACNPVYSNFRVNSGSGMVYSVEIRDLVNRSFACDCVDFRVNGLGTCKHAEAVLMQLQARFKKQFEETKNRGSDRLDIVPDYEKDTLRLECYGNKMPASLREWFDDQGLLLDEDPQSALERLRQLNLPLLRVSQETEPWLRERLHAQERKLLRREYEKKVRAGEWPPQETLVPLFPYQREGMLHLAFSERALLADEMGLGKTIQAIAACALLHRLGKAAHVLVVTPASLKTEWEDQIQRFTTLPYQLVYGSRPQRLQAYAQNIFFTIVNYEQMLNDALDVNERLRPDVVILDEAQRIKNWNTKTAQAVKRLRSRYAFVLTGTPIENRIDELHSLMDFLNPSVLGPLFRFNREYYVLDERGRPKEYRNLDLLHERIKPYMIRRRKSDVETELPERTDRTHFVPLSDEQRNQYDDHEMHVSRLMHAAKKRPLTQQELDKLMREMAMMRMICDTNYILNPEERECPKLAELQKILEECRDNPDVKLIVFSEWERMLMLVRELCEELEMGHAWHTGSVPQRRRRAEINLFKNDPQCRVFLTTDSGSTGLNLQNASVVVNCDLPWNPAKLEQRIARAWRKNQTRPVTVIHLVSEGTIEHKMISTLASKQALSDGILDLRGDLKEIKMGGGRQAFLAKLEQLIAPAGLMAKPVVQPKPLPADRSKGFCEKVIEKIDGALVRCEERYPGTGPHSVILLVVDRDAGVWKERLADLHKEYFGPGTADPLAPVQLEVIDRATDEALKRLMEAGLIGTAVRATRPLFPCADAAAPAPLSEEERQKINAHRAHTAKKWKMGRILALGGMPEEARQALLEATHAAARSLALENRLPEPAGLEDVLLPPLSQHFGEALTVLRIFTMDAAAPWEPASDALKKWAEPL
jgi:hypothetical protein